MLKVISHGAKIRVKNPARANEETDMINVVFQEEGRSGGDTTMSSSSAFLSKVAGGISVGLTNVRTHTHPVKADQIGAFPVGADIPGYINRAMYSTPQMRQQESVYSRMIDGKPTYFKTWLEEVPKDDIDHRMSNETLVQVDVNILRNARVGGTEVITLENAPFSLGVTQGNEAVGTESLAAH